MEPIKRNDTGAAVEDVQQRLARIGHLSEDAVTGTFDDATVAALATPGAQRRRMLELGFVPGAPVPPVQESPWGDPVAYAVCGAVIALRRADARQIAVRPLT